MVFEQSLVLMLELSLPSITLAPGSCGIPITSLADVGDQAQKAAAVSRGQRCLGGGC